MQLRLMASGQDEAPALLVLVHHPLEVGKQRRETLHLTQDTAVLHLAEESPRVGFGGDPDIRVFQGRIRFVGKRHPGQRGLAGLTGSNDGDHRIFRGGPNQLFCDVSRNHEGMTPLSCAKRKLCFRFAQQPLSLVRIPPKADSHSAPFRTPIPGIPDRRTVVLT